MSMLMNKSSIFSELTVIKPLLDHYFMHARVCFDCAAYG